MTDERTPEEVLCDAAIEIAQRGHEKGCFVNPETGAVCALGAIAAARGKVFQGKDGHWYISAFYEPTTDPAARLLKKRVGSIPAWNDAMLRRKGTVLRTMCSNWKKELKARRQNSD